jgi:Na+-translocating ferredoxin:NAD+ oxidoreductase RnfG subunit
MLAGDIAAVTGATNTSKAVVNAVNEAVNFVNGL